ncbi:MAG TPA: hypothetical protein VGM00_16700 [Bradyrhizobium sp.]
MIDSKQAIEALGAIDEIVRRVRQSQIYDTASKMMIVWGGLVLAGNLVTYFTPRYANYAWILVYIAGVAGSAAVGVFGRVRSGLHSLDHRTLAAFLLFFAFGFFCVDGLGHFTPRQMGTFWPIYFMLIYCIAGLWFGYAFIAIGLTVTALTLVGYFFVGAAFPLWMAFVNGGGLILGGLWMRRD